MQRKSIIALLLIMILSLVLVGGCGKTEKTEAPAAKTDAAEKDAEPAETEAEEKAVEPAADATVVKFAHDHTVTSPLHIASLEFKKLIEEKSNGRYVIDIYPTQQLGSSREMIEGMQMNTIEITFLPTAKFGGFDQRLNIADMPFLFPNEDIFFEIMDGEVGQEAMSGLTDIGIKGLSYIAEGYKSITNNVRPLKTPDDLKGLKMRTMETPLIMDMFSAWGANPVPIDFSEVYNSLQQGVADGQENPYLSTHDMKFYEVQKYMTISDHAYLSYFISCSNQWWESLSKEDQDMFMDVCREVSAFTRVKMAEANDGYYKVFEESGVEIYHLTDEEKALFREAVQPVYEQYKSVIGEDLLNRAIEQADKLSGN
jgi:tripartite ATP-independent transporter DctP family solute receptor